MVKIGDQLAQKRDRTLICYVTGGDPSIEDLPEILCMLQDAGVDAVEVGLPYSDPIADGPTIQASSQRALDRGVTPIQVFEGIKKAKLEIPVLVMGYSNMAEQIGYPKFADWMEDSGVCGSILSDLAPEHAGAWIEICRKKDLATVFLAAPTSSDARLAKIASVSTGFIYAVSRTGVTGQSESVSVSAQDLVNRIRQYTALPVCVGFGISRPDQVAEVCSFADGAIVGSWLVDRLHQASASGGKYSSVKRDICGLKGK